MNPQESQDFGHYYDGWDKEIGIGFRFVKEWRADTSPIRIAPLEDGQIWSSLSIHEPIEAYQAYHWRIAFRGGGE